MIEFMCTGWCGAKTFEPGVDATAEEFARVLLDHSQSCRYSSFIVSKREDQ